MNIETDSQSTFILANKEIETQFEYQLFRLDHNAKCKVDQILNILDS